MKMDRKRMSFGLSLMFSLIAFLLLVSISQAQNVTKETVECENLLTELDSGIAQKVGEGWCSIKSEFRKGVQERGYEPFSLSFDLMFAAFIGMIMLYLVTRGAGVGSWIIYLLLIIVILILLGIV